MVVPNKEESLASVLDNFYYHLIAISFCVLQTETNMRMEITEDKVRYLRTSMSSFVSAM
jgi:hypothetical protein